jgi:hypothetical protein
MEHAKPTPLGPKTTTKSSLTLSTKSESVTPPDILSGFVQIDELKDSELQREEYN